ncbi:unnamed protein product [Toxocara canis]|uniref:Uncharacterized protein n=1 Tax=Toxocara canis TaxID=6265 RepID=A0A3P7H926_TOXCA|nr:unnamed protein product [Toxocara canis]
MKSSNLRSDTDDVVTRCEDLLQSFVIWHRIFVCRVLAVSPDRRRPANDRYRIHARRLSARSESEASRGLSQMSVTPSEKSASLRLLWDDPQWDSELDLTRPDVLRRGQSASPSNISEMSEFLAAKNIFGDTASSKIDEEDDRVDAVLDSEASHIHICRIRTLPIGRASLASNLCRQMPNLHAHCSSVQDDTTSESMQQARDLIERSCMTDSQHLYRIVAGCIASSDAVSVCSERSTQSFLSLRQRAAASGTSAGLLELTRCSLAHGGGLEMLSNSMTDSAISKDTATTSSAARNMNRSMLFDSAIGTDLISSEDEACVAVPTSVSARVLRVPSNNDSSIIRSVVHS